ncbi:MAG: VanZ family protein [Spirosomataceae bacterium]
MQDWLKNTLKKPHLTLAWSLIMLGLCSIPGKNVPNLGWDKLYHFGAFGIFGALWYWVKLKPFLVILGGTTFGFFIEIWQHILPIGRTFDLYDGLADTIGLIVAVPIAHWVWKKT